MIFTNTQRVAPYVLTFAIFNISCLTLQNLFYYIIHLYKIERIFCEIDSDKLLRVDVWNKIIITRPCHFHGRPKYCRNFTSVRTFFYPPNKQDIIFFYLITRGLYNMTETNAISCSKSTSMHTTACLMSCRVLAF